MLKQTNRTLFFLAAAFLFLTGATLSAAYRSPDAIACRTGEDIEVSFCCTLSGSETSAKKNGIYSETRTLTAFGFLPIKEVTCTYYPPNEVVVGGELFGVRLNAGGVVVTDLGEVDTPDGKCCPAAAAGIQKGDLIVGINEVPIKTIEDFSHILAKAENNALTLSVVRGEQELSLTLQPVRDQDGTSRAGIWVRDGAAGIGTVTFRDPVTGDFAGLGHAVTDADMNGVFPMESGDVVDASILSLRRSDRGSPGEIHGKLGNQKLGEVKKNCDSGIFGTVEVLDQPATVPIGNAGELHVGKASILCTLDNNGKKNYEIEIEEILDNDRSQKNMVVHVTDPDLLALTGGILRGMSGSPILQDGKLVGAVTHVLVNDPTRGYGINIENMLNHMTK